MNQKSEQIRPDAKNTALQISTIKNVQKDTTKNFPFKHNLLNIDCVLLRFPHLGEQIFQELDNQDLSKSLILCRYWKKFIEDKKFYWIRKIVKITQTNCRLWRDNLLEKLLMNLEGQLVKKIGQAAEETRRDKEVWYRNVFYFAFVSGQTDFLKKLFDSSDFQNYTSDKEVIEKFLLYHAAEKGDLEVFQFVFHNAKVKNPKMQRYSCLKNTPFHVAAENGNLSICQLIIPYLKGGKNPRSHSLGRTPLELAANNGHFEVCKLIMSKIKIKNPENMAKQTPLHYASKNGHFDICEMIVSKIKDKSPKDHFGKTPLHYAAEKGHFSICELLMKNVEDKNPKGRMGMTPLHYAAKNGFVAICKLIIETLKFIHPQDNLRNTPFQLAEQNGHFEICQLFERNPKRCKLG
jgi:hypothetical protein